MAESPYVEGDWYDLPEFYDIVFDGDTVGEADFLEGVLERHGSPRSRENRRVLEPACGSGRLVSEFARRGYTVVGFDVNPHMLAAAQRRLDRDRCKASLKEDRMESFRARGKFDLAFCVLSSFKYLLTEEDARAHLQRAADLLIPGGIYVLGIHLCDYSSNQIHHERWVETRRGVEVVCNTRTWPPDRKRRREQLRNRLRVTKGGKTERIETLWECRTYNARQLQSLLRSVPELSPVACYDFCYDLEKPGLLTQTSTDDVVIVLRRTSGSRSSRRLR